MPRLLPLTIILLSAAAAVQAYQIAPAVINMTADKSDKAGKPERKAAFGDHERPWTTDFLTSDAPEQTPAKTDQPEAISPSKKDYEEELRTLMGQRSPVRALRLLRERETAIKAQEAHLADARALIEASRQALAEDLDDLQRLHDETRRLLTRLETAEEEDLERMSVLYQNMKSKEAATILNDLDTNTIAAVIERMPERIAAPILARMDVIKAREVMRIFADRKAQGTSG
ncbi:hypothetical protein GCM10007972_23610 [Iodidimonas muriae]|uniref:Magnesium transporter MgtE intracellular domain-containing protein n=1 Tax=Iodidimonas muriae TaxID=261467 RepID=A0ABQ2LFQ5_9PROT|nr:hypothetical protein [Iodidimonas muriae]GER08599.1 hypothetical protein JCM17843_29090 [Kordiimonadales bacterium JCM 17843]GGO15481.1 hypothetical protein GCM10007972_23610 [Iodidimonas muriae]